MSGTQMIEVRPRGKRPVEILNGHAAKQHGGRKGNEPIYSQALADEICMRISNGETLKAICEEERMPSRGGFLNWVYDDLDGLAERYARAREQLMDHWSEEIVTIADDQTAEPNDRRVRVDTRKWLMSKLHFRRYGDKLVHSGDPEHPVVVAHKQMASQPLDPQQLAAIARLIEARLGGPVIDVEAVDVTPADLGN